MSQRLKLVASVAGVMVFAVAALVGFIYSGIYNVAATEDHSAVVEWTFETMSERSVARRAGELPAPLPTDSMDLLHGLGHYRAMCEVCHAAPGVDRGEIGAGLNPRPPRLARSARGWSDAELFWITKHGIKATGMPGFGATHGDAALLQIVAIVRRLTDLSETDYADMVAALETSGLAGHHDPLASDSGAVHDHDLANPAHTH